MNFCEGPLERFSGEPFHHFGIHRVEFSWDERNPNLVVSLGHFKILGSIKLVFSDVKYHAVMSESYVYLHDEDEWGIDAFIAQAKQSRLIRHLVRYTLIESMGNDPAKLKHYRVIGQNFFVEIVATDAPQIILDVS